MLDSTLYLSNDIMITLKSHVSGVKKDEILTLYTQRYYERHNIPRNL